MEPSTLKVARPGDLHSAPDDAWLIVDVRTPGEYREAHIDGSENVPLGGLANHCESIKARANGREVAVVCRTGQRAERARRQLEAAGVENARVLDGGIVAWEKAGLPLNRGTTGMSLERQVRVAAGSLVLIGVSLGFLVHPGFFGLSGFVGAGLVFAGLTDTCGMGMLLAKMPWNTKGATCSRD